LRCENPSTSGTAIGLLTNLSRHWSVLDVETANSNGGKEVEREDEKSLVIKSDDQKQRPFMFFVISGCRCRIVGWLVVLLVGQLPDRVSSHGNKKGRKETGW
jgi:hypothetical protein